MLNLEYMDWSAVLTGQYWQPPCSFGICEVAAGEFHKGTHVVAVRQTLRWVDKFSGGAANRLPADSLTKQTLDERRDHIHFYQLAR